MDSPDNINDIASSGDMEIKLDPESISELRELWTYNVTDLISKLNDSFSVYRILDLLSFCLPKHFNDIANACFDFYNSKIDNNGKKDIFTLQSAISDDKLISFLIKKGLKLESKSNNYDTWNLEGDLYLPPKDSIEYAIINDNVEDFLDLEPNPKLVYDFLAEAAYYGSLNIFKHIIALNTADDPEFLGKILQNSLVSLNLGIIKIISNLIDNDSAISDVKSVNMVIKCHHKEYFEYLEERNNVQLDIKTAILNYNFDFPLVISQDDIPIIIQSGNMMLMNKIIKDIKPFKEEYVYKACECGNLEMFQYLMDKFKHINYDKGLIVENTIKSCNIKFIKYLYKNNYQEIVLEKLQRIESIIIAYNSNQKMMDFLRKNFTYDFSKQQEADDMTYLMYACIKNDFGIFELKKLTKNRKKIIFPDDEGNYEIDNEVLEFTSINISELNVTAIDKSGMTAISYCIDKNNRKLLNCLLETVEKYDINLYKTAIVTDLQISIDAGLTNFFQEINTAIDSFIELNKKPELIEISQKNYYYFHQIDNKWDCFILSCIASNNWFFQEIIQFWDKKTYNVTNDGWTPLLIVLNENDTFKFNLMTLAGYSISKEQIQADKLNPLRIAAKTTIPGAFDYVMNAIPEPDKREIINIEDESEFFPLFPAIKNKNIDMVKEFLKLGADPEKANKNGVTSTFYAYMGSGQFYNSFLEAVRQHAKPSK